jgi:hypothetical protein
VAEPRRNHRGVEAAEAAVFVATLQKAALQTGAARVRTVALVHHLQINLILGKHDLRLVGRCFRLGH